MSIAVDSVAVKVSDWNWNWWEFEARFHLSRVVGPILSGGEGGTEGHMKEMDAFILTWGGMYEVIQKKR